MYRITTRQGALDIELFQGQNVDYYLHVLTWSLDRKFNLPLPIYEN
jgi:hypothetical protein